MKTLRFEMRMDSDTQKRLDAWRKEQPDLPSRAEAVRRLVDAGIAKSANPEASFSDGEKLILFMLRDLYRKEGEGREMNPQFIYRAISGGHYWALDMKYPGLLDRRVDSGELIEEIIEVLNMWTDIEEDYARLSKKDKQRVKSEGSGSRPEFWGFSANEESEHLSATSFLVRDVERFSRFEQRVVKSHLPTVDAYRRMLAAYRPIRKKFDHSRLSASQIIDLLKERVHPEDRND